MTRKRVLLPNCHYCNTAYFFYKKTVYNHLENTTVILKQKFYGCKTITCCNYFIPRTGRIKNTSTLYEDLEFKAL